MPDEVDQGGSTVSDDANQAGRDINILSISSDSSASDSQIEALISQCENEIEDDDRVDELIEKLRYFERKRDEEGRSLEAKLSMGDREGYYSDAKRYKEDFNKKKTKLVFYPSAQHLLALLLERVEMEFDFKVKPLIENDEDEHVINEAIYNNILETILDDISSARVIISPSEVRGMIYYLTAKCIIDWHSN